MKSRLGASGSNNKLTPCESAAIQREHRTNISEKNAWKSREHPIVHKYFIHKPHIIGNRLEQRASGVGFALSERSWNNTWVHVPIGLGTVYVAKHEQQCGVIFILQNLTDFLASIGFGSGASHAARVKGFNSPIDSGVGAMVQPSLNWPNSFCSN